MTEKQIAIFMAVATTGTFSGAAESLNISEPAVSRSIKVLEKEMGCEFFRRSKGRRAMSLTEKGSIFFDIAKRWQYLIDDAKELSDGERQFSFRMTAVPSISAVLLPRVCHQLMNRHENLQLSIDSYHSRIATDLVAENQYDLAFVSFIVPNQRVQSIPLFKEDICLVCGRSDAPDAPIDLSVLNPAKQVFISWDTDNYIWEHFKYQNSQGARFDSKTVDGLSYYLNEMHMWALAPATYAWHLGVGSGLTVHEIIGDAPKRTTYALQYQHNSNPLIEEAMELIRDAARGTKGVELL